MSYDFTPDYSLDSGSGGLGLSANSGGLGLQAPTDWGYNPAFDFSGGGYVPTTSYELGSIFSGPSSGLSFGSSGEGLTATPSESGYDLGNGATGLGFSGFESPETSGFMDEDGRKMLMTLVSKMNPNIGKGLAVANAAQQAGKGSFAGLAGLFNPIAGIATAAAEGKNTAPASFGLAGGMMAGPLGAMIGNTVGNNLAGFVQPGYQGSFAQPNESVNNNSIGLSDIVKTLGGVYSSVQGANDARALTGGAPSSANITANVQTQLGEMFGPNSALAQQMRQQIERKDAAAGRRSQYGPREAQLAAEMAKLQASAAPALLNAQSNLATAQGSSAKDALAISQAQRNKENATLSMLFELGQKGGLFKGLEGMFGGSQQQVPQLSLPEQQYDMTNYVNPNTLWPIGDGEY